MGVFVDQFRNVDDILSNFQIERVDGEVLFAYYGDPYGYSGLAFVLCRGTDGGLYEVNGSHCSCMGLEGQWGPEGTSVEAIRHRIEHGTLGDECNGSFAPELMEVLNGV